MTENKPADVINFEERIHNRPRPGTYYNRPAVRPSLYGWRIATGFFAIGIGAGCQILSTLLDVAGREEDRPLVRAGRYLAVAGAAAGPLLYVADLHTPQRWFNMLRIFRKTSLMSIGSWSLTAFGALSGLTAFGQLLEDAGYGKAGKQIARIAEIPAALSALIPSLYKGTELEETSVPLWASAFPFLGPLLASSDAKSAASALSLVNSFRAKESSRKSLDLISVLSGGLELLFAVTAAGKLKGRMTESDPSGKGPLSAPYGVLLGISILGPLALKLLQSADPKSPAPSRIASGAGILGGFILPVALIFAGNRSGRKPSEYFSYARQGNGTRESTVRKNLSTANIATGLVLTGAAALFYGLTRVKEKK